MNLSRCVWCLGVSLIISASVFPPIVVYADQPHFTPRLHSGQTLFYRIEFHSTRLATAESHFSSPQLPPAGHLDFSGLLQIEVREVTADGFRLKTYLSERQSTAPGSSQPPGSSSQVDKIVDFFLAPSGSASQITGFDKLSAAQQAAWTGWLSRFTSSMSFPSAPHVGRKWQTTEPETTPAPIAHLSWIKKFQYVRDEPCPFEPQASSAKRNDSTGSCAVILIAATLRQKSSPQNATPHDYTLNNLKTQGTARGQNETVLYLSRSQGLLVRATESAQQAMAVTIFLADNSNQVHYQLDAKSRSEIVLLPDSSQ